jgi:hypothetical protein
MNPLIHRIPKLQIIKQGLTHTLITIEPFEVQHRHRHVHLKEKWAESLI